jgi:NADH-quinone oxidoreductase subunit C
VSRVDFAEQLDLLKQAMPDVSIEQVPSVDQLAILVPAAAIADVARALRTHPSLQYQVLAELTGVDLWPVEPRFEVVYHFAALGAHALGDPQAPPPARLRVKVRVPGDAAVVPSICAIYPNANWYEREVYDLFGVWFSDHPDLRRILMPDDWEGHPARKDYPVQVKLPVDAGMPLQVTEEEFVQHVAQQRATAPKGRQS